MPTSSSPPSSRTSMPGAGAYRRAVLAEKVGGDDADLGHPVHVAEPDRVPVGEALPCTSARTSSPPVVMPVNWGSFGGSSTEASSSMWNGTPITVVGASPAAIASWMRVDGHPLRQHQVDAARAGRRAGRRPGPSTCTMEASSTTRSPPQRYAGHLRVPVDLGEQAGRGAADDLRRAGRAGAELEDRVRGAGRVAVVRPRSTSSTSWKARSAPVTGAAGQHDGLRAQPLVGALPPRSR